ncbi:phosphate signaling complex protein PhoU [Nocardia sp. NPDC046763]|uniref:phosphate signaling complex protein PhoU n=1 Tax=Nocardia sp. NPDC046763 TaxID=3155256 RepID=UPI0033F5433A
MRTQYHADLARLATQLVAMSLHDRTAVASATNALLNADLEQAEHTIDVCAEIDTMRDRCEKAAVGLLARQAPVASELRQVVTALHLVSDLARMATLASHIANVARRRHPGHAVPDSVRPIVARMGDAAVAIVSSAAQVLDSRDPGDAARLDQQDDVMDELHRELFTTVLGPDWTDGVTAAVDLALLGRYYERFADHAVQVGRRTIFLVTGEDPQTWLKERQSL